MSTSTAPTPQLTATELEKAEKELKELGISGKENDAPEPSLEAKAGTSAKGELEPIGGEAIWDEAGTTLVATYTHPKISVDQMWNAFTPWNTSKWQKRLLHMSPLKDHWHGDLRIQGTKIAFVGAGLVGPMAMEMTMLEYEEDADFKHAKLKGQAPANSVGVWQFDCVPLNEDGTGAKGTTTFTLMLSSPMKVLFPFIRKRFTNETRQFRVALRNYLENGEEADFDDSQDMEASGFLVSIAKKLMKPPKLPEFTEWPDYYLKTTVQERLDGAIPSRGDLVAMGKALVPSGREGDKAAPVTRK